MPTPKTQLNPFHQLDGHLLAIQVVLQRTVGALALMTRQNIPEVMRIEHGCASDAIAQTVINGDERGAEEIRACAQAMIDNIYAVASTTRPASPGPAKTPRGPTRPKQA